MITDAINEASNLYITKGCIRAKNPPIPEPIKTKIAQRNQLRETNPNDVNLPRLNDEIKEDINKHKTDLWHEKMSGDKWSHKTNSKQYWSTMKQFQDKQAISTNRSITFNIKIVTTDQQKADNFNKMYTSVAPKITTKDRRKTTRKVKKWK